MISSALETAQLLFALLLGAAILFALHRFLGWRGVAAGLVAIATLLLYRKGREDGRSQVIEKGAADVGRAERIADAERTRSDLRNADPDELRRSDGFRRD